MEKAAAAACGWRKGLEEGEPEWEAMELEAAAPAIFPADGGGGGGGGGRRSPAASTIFLPDLLDGSFLSDDILPDLNQMEDIFQPAHEDDIHHLLQGPQDEADLDKWLADFIPKDGCKRGPRGARKRQTFPSRGARTRRAFPLDKWRNLLKACGIDFTSTAKGNAQKTMLWPLDKRLIEQITQLAYKHPYPRQKY
uniref:Uncharacterized protein n=1 Tax=Oryza glumipatula TaxID=40148 RepID=A0A0E0BB26_9ORYZ